MIPEKYLNYITPSIAIISALSIISSIIFSYGFYFGSGVYIFDYMSFNDYLLLAIKFIPSMVLIILIAVIIGGVLTNKLKAKLYTHSAEVDLILDKKNYSHDDMNEVKSLVRLDKQRHDRFIKYSIRIFLLIILIEFLMWFFLDPYNDVPSIILPIPFIVTIFALKIMGPYLADKEGETVDEVDNKYDRIHRYFILAAVAYMVLIVFSYGWMKGEKSIDQVENKTLLLNTDEVLENVSVIMVFDQYVILKVVQKIVVVNKSNVDRLSWFFEHLPKESLSCVLQLYCK